MKNDYVAVSSENVSKYLMAKQNREDLFKKPFSTADDLVRSYQAMIDAALAIAEESLPE